MPTYGVRDLFSMVLRHRRELVVTNFIALGKILASVPVSLPLLLPMDEAPLDCMSGGGFDNLPARLARALRERRP